jgi:hypothetical protein
VENDRETGKSLDALLENVKSERRRYKDAVSISCALSCRELVGAVACSDSDGQGVAACPGYEFLNLFRSCVSFLTGLYNNLILDTC